MRKQFDVCENIRKIPKFFFKKKIQKNAHCQNLQIREPLGLQNVFGLWKYGNIRGRDPLVEQKVFRKCRAVTKKKTKWGPFDASTVANKDIQS